MIAVVLASFLLLQTTPAVQPRPGVVTGELRTIEGDPAIAVRVAAIPELTGVAIPEDGPNYFNFPAAVSTTLTDSQGRYRLENVPPGRYYILAGLTDEPTYYPAGVAAASGRAITGATAVAVDPGATVTGLDFQLLWPIGSTVSGRVRGGRPAPGVTATLSGARVEELLEVPVAPDGAFRFGSVLPGVYLLSLFPPPPGFVGQIVRVEETDITGIELVPPPTRTISGRIVVEDGTPVPRGILAFYTPQSYVAATIHPDETFSAEVHAARHRIDVAGMPVGYRVNSARLGGETVQGFMVEDEDVSDLVITLAVSRRLPEIRGRVAGLSNPAPGLTVELSGPIVGTLTAPVQADGSFDFGAVPPGLYLIQAPESREIVPRQVAVDGQGVTEVQLSARSR